MLLRRRCADTPMRQWRCGMASGGIVRDTSSVNVVRFWRVWVNAVHPRCIANDQGSLDGQGSLKTKVR